MKINKFPKTEKEVIAFELKHKDNYKEPKEWPLEVYDDCEEFTCECKKDGCQTTHYYAYEGGIDDGSDY